MIIKFKSCGQWVVFGEIDHVEYGDAEEMVGKPSNLLEYPAANDAAAGTKKSLSFFSKNMTEATVIEAYTPIYLMNDHGQTVETI